MRGKRAKFKRLWLAKPCDCNDRKTGLALQRNIQKRKHLEIFHGDMFSAKFNINFNMSINAHENFKYNRFKRYRTLTFKKQLWRQSHGDITVLSKRFQVQSTFFFKKTTFSEDIAMQRKPQNRKRKRSGIF